MRRRLQVRTLTEIPHGAGIEETWTQDEAYSHQATYFDSLRLFQYFTPLFRGTKAYWGGELVPVFAVVSWVP